MLRLTVLCSSIHSVFTSSCVCFVFCISHLCLFFLSLVAFFGHVTIFRKTCARDPSERRLVQNQNEYLLCWQPFSLVKYVKRMLYCEAFGSSNTGADILVYNVIVEMWTSCTHCYEYFVSRLGCVNIVKKIMWEFRQRDKVACKYSASVPPPILSSMLLLF